jgi:hypothetical protein
MPRLVVERVRSTSQLGQSLLPGDADEHGTFDGEVLVVDDGDEAAALVERHPNIHWADGEPSVSGDGGAEDFDVAAFVDRTPMDDVVADIKSGEYDAHLDAIEAEASRQGVLDTIDGRRE